MLGSGAMFCLDFCCNFNVTINFKKKINTQEEQESGGW